MYTGNLPEVAAKTLQTINDTIRVEQYMDYIHNRRFRQDLLCHAGLEIKRQIDDNMIDKFYLRANFRPKDNQNIDLTQDQEIFFEGGVNCTSKSRLNTALLLTLCEQKRPISTTDLLRQAADKLNMTDVQELRKVLYTFALRFVFAGALLLSSDAGDYVTELSEKPKAHPLIKYQVEQNYKVITNVLHQGIGVDDLTRYLLCFADGTNTAETISTKIIDKVNEGKLKVTQANQLIMDPQQIDVAIRNWVKAKLEEFTRLAVFVE